MEQPGLRVRVRQEGLRISSQHRQLDGLYAAVGEALRRGARGEAISAFTRLRDALEAHFSLEDELYFPAVHGMHPDCEALLTSLVDDHRRFRSELDAVGRGLAAHAPLEGCLASLDALAEEIGAHERREEELVARVGRPLRDD